MFVNKKLLLLHGSVVLELIAQFVVTRMSACDCVGKEANFVQLRVRMRWAYG